MSKIEWDSFPEDSCFYRRFGKFKSYFETGYELVKGDIRAGILNKTTPFEIYFISNKTNERYSFMITRDEFNAGNAKIYPGAEVMDNIITSLEQIMRDEKLSQLGI